MEISRGKETKENEELEEEEVAKRLDHSEKSEFNRLLYK